MSQKLRIAQKKSFMQKNECQFNSNPPSKFGHFWRKLNFFGHRLGARGAQTRNHVIGNFTLIIFLSTLRIFYVKITTSDGGRGGLQPLIVTGPIQIRYTDNSMQIVKYILNHLYIDLIGYI